MSHPVIYATFNKPSDPEKTTKKNTVVAGQKKNFDDNDYEDSFKVKKVSHKQSQKIREFRTKFTMSRDDLGKASGINHTVLAYYENGTADFRPGEWDKINNTIDKLTREKTQKK